MTLKENGLREAEERREGRNRHLSEVSIAKVASGSNSEDFLQWIGLEFNSVPKRDYV